MENPLLSYKIATLSLEDAKAIIEIEQQCFTMPWSLEQCSFAFGQKHFFAMGIKQELDNSLLGYISYYHVLDELEILNIAVLPRFRRQGLAKDLLINTLQTATKKGMLKAALEVRPSNVAACKLYEAIGFECVGKRPKYYKDPDEDALIYTLSVEN